MLVILIGSIITVYKAPSLRYPFFGALLIWLWRSDKAYIWLALLMVYTNVPALLFYHTEATSPYRLPLFGFGAGSLSLQDVMVLLALAKALRTPNRRPMLLVKHTVFLGLYVGLITLPASFLFDTDAATVFNILRSLVWYVNIYSFAQLIRNPRDVVRMSYVLLPVALIVLAAQAYVIQTGTQLVGIIDPTLLHVVIKNTTSGENRPIIYGEYVLFVEMITCTIMLLRPHLQVFRPYAMIVIALCYSGFVLAAARGWISIPAVMFVLVFLGDRRSGRIVGRVVLNGILMLIVASISGVLSIDYLERNVFAPLFRHGGGHHVREPQKRRYIRLAPRARISGGL